MNKLKSAALLAIIILATAGCGIKSDKKVLKMGHSLERKHSVHIAMKHMADRVKIISDGKLQIDISPDGVIIAPNSEKRNPTDLS